MNAMFAAKTNTPIPTPSAIVAASTLRRRISSHVAPNATKKQAAAALKSMSEMVVNQLGKHGPGEILIPGLLKLNVVVKPATPEREGINPFTKEPMTFAAKPAKKVVKARPMKALKDAIA